MRPLALGLSCFQAVAESDLGNADVIGASTTLPIGKLWHGASCVGLRDEVEGGFFSDLDREFSLTGLARSVENLRHDSWQAMSVSRVGALLVLDCCCADGLVRLCFAVVFSGACRSMTSGVLCSAEPG